ncbi:Phenoxybenzoate dioxygenase subunit beta [Aquimixticola soesokkakensis]|uniref:Phenoxybenzoate dioxygenase subunit beta n=1 Tax=Aquimixticola soesokkakensis TaxID=1519096 RepID=A0A1Y5TE19_9RHOB|nr:PDR/VanB family oxidoreductase [Aquimixticola soesokkakensis]SLN59847.1 Phenoxybenzoate dioxygenase subunit beta [Aquimixticola soesokkakensis]
MTQTETESLEHDVIVSARHKDLGDILRVTLTGADLPRFSAGAHIDVLVDMVGGPVWRQYSLCGDPATRDSYTLGVLRDPQSRGGSLALHEGAKLGERLRIAGPRNHFALTPEAELSVLYGGGVGVTPMIAMGLELAAAGKAFTLHYSTKSRARTAFLDVVEAAPFAGRTVLHPSDSARLDLLADIPAPSAGTHLYVCGPEAYMAAVIAAAEAKGHAPDHIHREYFAADVDTTGDSFEVYAQASDVTVTVGPTDTIAKALAKAGIKIEVKCEEGVCGTCVTDVIEGEIDHRDMFLTEDERADGDQICACCSRACSKRLVLDV